MQISKLISAVCAAAFCAGFTAVRAQDTPAQAAARAALMEKMNELETQSAQPAPPPVVVTPAGAMQVKASQPTNMVVVPSPVAPAQPAQPALATPESKSTPGPEAAQTMPATSEAEVQAKAEAALQQKMSELDKQNWASPTVVPVTPPPQTQPMATSPVKPTPPMTQPAAMSPPSQVNANYPGKELGLKPIVAPPLPISVGKEAQLRALLARYKADQITPEQYQTARAKILAEP